MVAEFRGGGGEGVEAFSLETDIVAGAFQFGKQALGDSTFGERVGERVDLTTQAATQPAGEQHHQQAGPEDEEQASWDVEIDGQDRVRRIFQERAVEEVLADALQHEADKQQK